jgi:predicted RNA-binding Zn-ribbon protein involved in translation (DUF1610 family)
MNLKHNLKGSKLCTKCNKRISSKSPKTKYCPKCAKEVWNEQVKNNMREYRKRKKNEGAL